MAKSALNKSTLSTLNLSPSQLDEIPTPAYIYSEQNLRSLLDAFHAALDKRSLRDRLHWHYAIKANHNPHLLNVLKDYGAGIDLVSGYELSFALEQGFAAKDMVFSGVGKSQEELELAVGSEIGLLQIESAFELDDATRVARRLGKPLKVSFRVNPDIDPKTHPYISTGLNEHKFGMTFEQARALYLEAVTREELIVEGMSLHIGSQMRDLAPLKEAIDLSIDFATGLHSQGVSLKYLNVGGGLGVNYEKLFELPDFESYADILDQASQRWQRLQGPRAMLFSECGRALTAQAGFLLTKVIGIKKGRSSQFAIVDASMTELLRPSLYQATHPIWALKETASGAAISKEQFVDYEFVGPVCESSDVLARNVPTAPLEAGDHCVIGAVGAYGYVMASHYNMRPLPSEYFLDTQNTLHLSRKRCHPTC